MEYLIRQRVFSWTDTYDIYAPDSRPLYEVRAEFFSLGHKLHIYDKQTGTEVGQIRQRLFALLPRFEIWQGGRFLGYVSKKLSLFAPRYEVDYMGWTVSGNLFGWDYTVFNGSTPVLTISKELFRWGDTYVLSCPDPGLALHGLLLVLAIDAANCSHN